MATGRYTSDLEVGDTLGPVEYTMCRFVVREYAHANELHQPCFQEKDGQFAPPTLVHLDKLRLYKIACPGGAGPSARVHYEYDATIHAPIPVDVPLRVSGKVTETVQLSVDLLDTFKNKPPTADTKKNDVALVTSLAAKF